MDSMRDGEAGLSDVAVARKAAAAAKQEGWEATIFGSYPPPADRER